MKYCIGCVHFYYYPGSDAYYYSEWTSSNGEPPSSSCRKGKWSAKMDEEFTQEAFQSAMEQAETCELFEERSVPVTSAEHKP